MLEELQYAPDFWGNILDPGMVPTDTEAKIHLVLSLVTFLALPLHELFIYIFSCDIKSVKARATRFLTYQPPATFRHERWPHSIQNLHDMVVQPCAEEIALKESDNIINDSSFKIKLHTLTIARMRELLGLDKKAQYSLGGRSSWR
ncbi:hypothetical protein K466DRAFT_604525 [Polyporus arcularius HHB13444]|uniref:Uncharacterized protein n=1 Tax=Polyporus arcularius HHB13444 TaxID=1314778 RepID=A0A5C3NWG8_9APHY|nr:hypothetical protein K466DRAFT_604525 [Polyporus arcularius HHB13444]